MEQSFSNLTPNIVLGIVAHPDDLDVGAGGTMAAFAKQGAEVHYLILTDGGKGSNDPALTSAELTTIRRQEQRDALEILGGKQAHFLDYPDGELEISMILKKDIVKAIRTIKPDVVVTLDPTLVYSARAGIINHPDHRAAGQAVLDAVFPLARDHLTFPELLEQGYQPHKTPTILLINFDAGNFAVDITDTFELKKSALKAHTSQFGDLEGSTWLRDMAKRNGEQAGYELAESFVRLDIRG
jgi:LmbE family N-acetylglucosaminyl deacetylase